MRKIRLGICTVLVDGKHVPQVYDVYTGAIVEMVTSVKTEMNIEKSLADVSVTFYAFPEDILSGPTPPPTEPVEPREHRMIDAADNGVS